MGLRDELRTISTDSVDVALEDTFAKLSSDQGLAERFAREDALANQYGALAVIPNGIICRYIDMGWDARDAELLGEGARLLLYAVKDIAERAEVEDVALPDLD